METGHPSTQAVNLGSNSGSGNLALGLYMIKAHRIIRPGDTDH